MLTIDDREIQEAQSHHNLYIPDQLEIPCTVERLEAGDYAFLNRDSNPTGIERCEIGNLIQKLRSGELVEQLHRCRDNYTSIILLIEGVYDQMEGLVAMHRAGNRGYFRTHIYPHTYYEYVKALEVRLSELGIEVLNSANFQCSMSLVRTIYHQRTKPEEEHTLFQKTRVLRIPVKWTTNPAVPRLMSLVPRLPEQVAIKLIGKYETIWAVVQADDRELQEIGGMGRTLVQRLRENIGQVPG